MESVIVSHQGAQIREHKLSGPLVNSHFRVKATTHDLQDHSSTLWCQHLNSMLSDNRYAYVLRISTDIDIAPAKNHNKP